MAFLEAQALGQEFRVLRREVQAAEETCEKYSDAWSRNSLAPLALAMAASFLVAFGLGAWWRSGAAGGGRITPPNLVERERKDVPESMLADRTPPSEPVSAVSSGMPTDRLTFVLDRGDGQDERFEMPVYDQNDAYARQLLERDSALPPHVEHAIRRSGYDVRTQREWAPVETRDGRRIIFPVDHLEITPVSGKVFQ